MAETLLKMVNEVLQVTSQNPNKTSFSDIDHTNLIVTWIRQAELAIADLKPTYIEADVTITVTPSTQLFAPPLLGMDLYTTYTWGWRVQYNGSWQPVKIVSLEYIESIDPNFEVTEGACPLYLYFKNGQFGIYPLLQAGSATTNLKGTIPVITDKKTNPSDVFPYPDTWLRFLKLHAQMKYELKRGLGQPAATETEKNDVWGVIVGSIRKQKKLFAKQGRVYR